MEYKFNGHIIRPNGDKLICKNCGCDVRMMKAYIGEDGNEIYRCGLCDDIEKGE